MRNFAECKLYALNKRQNIHLYIHVFMIRIHFTAAAMLLALGAMAQQNVPYTTSFDNTYGEYDGTSFLPVGWVVTGDEPFFTASTDELKAHTGTYYLISPNNSRSIRNEHLYTPLFHLEAGQTYDVKYFLYMPGYDYAYLNNGHYAEAYHHPIHHLTVGEEQDFDFHSTDDALITINGDVLPAEWIEQTAHYTPTETGDYCFCLSFTSDDINYGNIAIDDFEVSCQGVCLPPAVNLAYGGWFNLFYSCITDFEGGGIPFSAITTNTTGYEWTVKDDDSGKTVATSTEENPRFFFPETGNYSVTLRGYNKDFEDEKTIKIPVVHVGTEGMTMTPLYNYDESVNTIFATNYTPVIGLEDPIDFATGPNHTYRTFAERVEMPENVEMTLVTLQYFLSQCSFVSKYSGNEGTTPFRFSIYGETDGLPDETKLIWRKDLKMSDAFTTNTGGLGAATQMSRSLENAKARGTFYIAFEFSDELSVDPWNAGGDRTYIEMTSLMHHDRRTTFYYKDAKTKEWHPLDYFHPDLAGFGMNLVLWASASVDEADGIVNVTATSPAAKSTTYDLQGRSLNADTTKNAIHGIYIVNGKKVIK